MKYTRQELTNSAERFLRIADRYNEQVSAFLNGSNKNEDVEAYFKVKDANADFILVYCDYYGEKNFEPALDYELAESCIA